MVSTTLIFVVLVLVSTLRFWSFQSWSRYWDWSYKSLGLGLKTQTLVSLLSVSRLKMYEISWWSWARKHNVSSLARRKELGCQGNCLGMRYCSLKDYISFNPLMPLLYYQISLLFLMHLIFLFYWTLHGFGTIINFRKFRS